MRNSIFYIVLLLLPITGCKQRALNKQLNQAHKYYVEGDYNEAIEIYHSLLIDMPYNQVVLFNNALAKHKVGDDEMAITLLTRLIEVDNENIEAYYQRGMFYFHRAMYSECINDFEIVAESGQFDINEINYYLGICYFSKQLMIQALQKLERVKNSSAYKVDADYWAGYIYEYLGDWNSAIDKYKSILNEGNYKPEYYYRMGFCHEKIIQESEAKKYYSTAIQINNNFSMAYQRRAYLFFKNRYFQSAIADYNSLMAIDSLNKALALKGIIASNLMLGNIGLVKTDIEELQDVIPDDRFTLHIQNFINTYESKPIISDVDVFTVLNNELNAIAVR